MTPPQTLEREAVTLPRTPAQRFYDLNKMPTMTFTMWGILFISRLWPRPHKNLVFRHEVTNHDPTLTLTLALGEGEGGRGAHPLSRNFALQCEPCNPNHTSPPPKWPILCRVGR